MAEWIFFSAPEQSTNAEFSIWLQEVASKRLASISETVSQCRMHLPSTNTAAGFLSDGAPASTDVDGYSAALLLDGAAADTWRDCIAALGDGIGRYNAVQATATVVKDSTDTSSPTADATTYLRPITFHADMQASAAQRSWTLHAPFAVRTHVGAARYVQWWVDATLCANVAPIEGIVELHFLSSEDLGQQFFPTEFAREDIARDTGHFIAGGPRLYTRELRLS